MEPHKLEMMCQEYTVNTLNVTHLTVMTGCLCLCLTYVVLNKEMGPYLKKTLTPCQTVCHRSVFISSLNCIGT